MPEQNFDKTVLFFALLLLGYCAYLLIMSFFNRILVVAQGELSFTQQQQLRELLAEKEKQDEQDKDEEYKKMSKEEKENLLLDLQIKSYSARTSNWIR